MGYPAAGGAAGSSRPAQVTWPVRVGAVPPVAEKFSTRPESAPSIADALRRSRAVTLTSSQVDGTEWADLAGACGKTQLAAFHAESLWNDRGLDLLVWVDASSRASIVCGYCEAGAAVAGTAPLVGAEARAASFVEWLAQTNRKWLVVLDDLADAAAVHGLWPQGSSGQVLVTARDSESLGDRSLCLEVGAYSRRDAMSYLVGRLTSDPEQRRGAIELIEDLSLQPLALAQASSVVMNSWLTCSDYRDLLAARQRQLAETTGVKPPASAITWMVAAEQAEVLLPGGAAQACLAFAALLDGHGIPVDVFATTVACDYMAGARAGRNRPPEPSFGALQALEQVGLVVIDRTGQPPTVQMNPAVQSATRAAIPANVLQRAAAAASAALLECWPDGDQGSRHAQLLRSGALSLLRGAGEGIWAAGCPTLFTRAGQSLDSAGLTVSAMDYWAELAAMSDRLLGPGHPDSSRLVEHLAKACQTAGYPEAAVAWHRRLAEDRARSLGPEHRLTLAAQVSLGRSMSDAGDFLGAIAVLDATLAAMEAEGVAGPETLGLRDELAVAYMAAGRADGAIRLLRGVLAERERSQGPAHQETIATRQKLADAYAAGGRLKDAVSQFKRVIADRERVDGPADRATLRSRSALAAAYQRAGRMANALELHERVRSDCERALGPDDPDTLVACLSLARTYYALGHLGNAVPLLRDMLARCSQALPPDDPLTRQAREMMATIGGQ
jgi:tetratricopeptide (TPR) repeat protein